MASAISRIWFSAADIGVTEQQPFSEKVKIRLLNKVFMLGIICALILISLSPLTPNPRIYMLEVGSFVFLQVLVIILHARGKITFARYFSSFIFPVTTAFLMIYSRAHFGEGYIFVLSIFVTFILYNENLLIRNVIIGIKLLIYILAVLYIYLNPAPSADSSIVDEHVVFIMCILAMGLIILLYQKELAKNQHRQKILIDQLREKNEALSDTNSELERFTYIASHDLKSPLRTIINFLEVIEHSIKKKRYQNLPRTLKHVKSGAQQMNYLVSDILEYSSLNNKKDLEREPIDLNQIVERIKMNLQVEIDRKEAVVFHSDLPKVIANEIEFTTLFQNLIENGIKYNESDTPVIKITAEYMDENFVLKFRDNGIGIESKYHDRIFELFQRLHTLTDFEGTGLGLGICAKIVKLYQGEIWVESSPGQGSVFVIQLPLAALA
jgi:signal transduction histidine kinase